MTAVLPFYGAGHLDTATGLLKPIGSRFLEKGFHTHKFEPPAYSYHLAHLPPELTIHVRI